MSQRQVEPMWTPAVAWEVLEAPSRCAEEVVFDKTRLPKLQFLH